MEIKAELTKPYEEMERLDFIIENNHKLGYVINETEIALQAWGYTQVELDEQEKERIAKLSLTRGDVFRGVLKATGKTKADIKALVEAMPETTPEEIQMKELARIDLDDSLDFYRGVPIVGIIGNALGFTDKQLDRFFETNDYKELKNADTTNTDTTIIPDEVQPESNPELQV